MTLMEKKHAQPEWVRRLAMPDGRETEGGSVCTTVLFALFARMC